MLTEILQQPYKLVKADNGGIIFEAIAKSTNALQKISLFAKECPHLMLYEIIIDYSRRLIILKKEEEQKTIDIPICLIPFKSRKFWLSWNNGNIKLGLMQTVKHQDPFFEYQDKFSDENPKQIIGYIKFKVTKHVDWNVQSTPVDSISVSLTAFDGGELRWEKIVNKKLPFDALIGGFENEPLYIARAGHNRSLCPGKYVLSKNLAFVPWGHMEHQKRNFEILCGYNAAWVKCTNNNVPENAFVGGISEVNHEVLYIGRAMIDDDLVVGKVHLKYKSCFLPYKGHEVERSTYEILVRTDVETKGETCNKMCLLDPLRFNQPCI